MQGETYELKGLCLYEEPSLLASEEPGLVQLAAATRTGLDLLPDSREVTVSPSGLTVAFSNVGRSFCPASLWG